MSAPSAAWPTPTLIGSLARAGWGSLAGRKHAGVRAILRALVDVLPHGSGKGHTTGAQLADVAGYSDRWTYRALGILEDLGIITWQRGHIIDGTAHPATITIIKTALADLVRAARNDGTKAARTLTRAAARAVRIAKYGTSLYAPRRRTSLPEVSTGLPFHREVTGHGVTSPPINSAPTRPPGDPMHKPTPEQDHASTRPYRPTNVKTWAERARAAIRNGNQPPLIDKEYRQ